MSLRTFHIVFVTLATLLSVFFALWGFVFSSEKDALATTVGVIGAIFTIVMPIYGVCFYRKAKHILV